MRRLSAALLMTVACASPATSAADPPKPEPVRMNIEVSGADATAQWARATALVAKCTSVDVTIWYPSGSARVRAAPESPGRPACRVDVETEVEGDRRRLTCALAAGAAFEWNLVTDGGKPRQAPPRDPPPGLAAKCK